MPLRQAFALRATLRRARFSPLDIVVAVGILAVLYALVRLGRSMTVDFTPGHTKISISTSPGDIPYYAARSLLRMFIALTLSTAFTFGYGVAAARGRGEPRRC